jgi:kinesin family protein 18/19
MINNQQNNQSKNVTLPLLTDRRGNILSNNINNNGNNNNIINENLNNNKIEDETKNYIDDLKKGSYNILVVVRCRPLSILESQISSYETIRIMDNKMVVLMDPIEYNGPNSVFKNRSREITYAFDFAFDKYSTQKEIYDHSTKFLLDGVVNGYNATVFAYGATGAGKTYTMTGTDNNPGIMPLTLTELFNKVNSYTDREYKLTKSYLEIYNENIRDLLKFANPNYNNNNLNNTNDEYLDLREDPNKGIIVSNITELNVSSCKDILNILKRGNRNRTQEATGANETSSRSHAVLQVSIEYKEKTTGIDVEIKFSKLSLIDSLSSIFFSASVVNPTIAFIGVLISCDIADKKSVLALFAVSASLAAN